MLSAVIPHWPLDEEVDKALRTCLASLEDDDYLERLRQEGIPTGRSAPCTCRAVASG